MNIFSIILYSIIAIVVCICLGKLMQSEGGKKLVFYILSAVIIFGACVCGVQLYKEITAKSYVNGSIDIQNQFVAESFEYSNDVIVFNKESENLYVYEVDFIEVKGFNGEEKEYQIKLNNYDLFNADIKAGSIESEVQIDFYDTNGELLNSSNLNIKVEFLSNKTNLKLATDSLEESEYLTQYFQDRGFTLKILELKGDNK